MSLDVSAAHNDLSFYEVDLVDYIGICRKFRQKVLVQSSHQLMIDKNGKLTIIIGARRNAEVNVILNKF